jgi:hypothetical protein
MWCLPLLSLVWANWHGGFFIGLAVCGAYCVDALVRRAPDARRLLLISGISILISGLNPNGFGVVMTLFRYRSSYLTSTLLEWRHADLWGVPYSYDVLLYLTIAILIAARKRVRISDWLLFVLFAVLSLAAIRNLLFFALFAPVLIATYFPWSRRLPVSFGYIAAAALIAATVWGTARGSFYQLRAGEWRYPSGAVEFLRRHVITAPIFNTYFIGGYLIWRGERVFIDGRALSESVYRDYQTILNSDPGGSERPALLARYGIGAIVMDSYEYVSGIPHPLVRALAYPNMSEWKLVYEQPDSMVFLREVPPGVPVLGKERIADHLEAECRQFIEHVPRFPDCARRLAFLVSRTNPARARRAFELYFEHGGNDADARTAYQQLLR